MNLFSFTISLLIVGFTNLESVVTARCTSNQTGLAVVCDRRACRCRIQRERLLDLVENIIVVTRLEEFQFRSAFSSVWCQKWNGLEIESTKTVVILSKASHFELSADSLVDVRIRRATFSLHFSTWKLFFHALSCASFGSQLHEQSFHFIISVLRRLFDQSLISSPKNNPRINSCL